MYSLRPPSTRTTVENGVFKDSLQPQCAPGRANQAVMGWFVIVGMLLSTLAVTPRDRESILAPVDPAAQSETARVFNPL